MVYPEFDLRSYCTLEEMYKAKAEYFERKLREYESTIDTNYSEFHVLVSERGCSNWMESEGPLVHETSGHQTLGHAIKTARKCNRQGKMMICRLVPVGPPESFKF